MYFSLKKFTASRLFVNGIWIYIVQATGYIAPLVTMPFLARSLGPSGLGDLGLMLQLMALCVIIIDYGFSVNAVRKASVYIEDTRKFESIISEVLTVKAGLSLIIIFLGLIVVLIKPQEVRSEWIVLTVCLSLFQGLNFFWLFQSLEKLIVPAIADLCSKFLTLFLVYIFSDKMNVSIALACYVIPSGVSLITSIIYIKRVLKITLYFADLKMFIATVAEGWSWFFLRFLSHYIQFAGAILFVWLISRQNLGYFFGADRIIKAGLAFIWPIPMLLLPYFSKIAQNENKKEILKHKNLSIMAVGAIVGLTLTGLTNLFAPALTQPWFFGTEFEGSVDALKILSFLLPLTFLTNTLTYQWLTPLQLSKQLVVLYIFAIGASCLYMLFFGRNMAHLGASLALITHELVFLIGSFYVLWSKKLI